METNRTKTGTTKTMKAFMTKQALSSGPPLPLSVNELKLFSEVGRQIPINRAIATAEQIAQLTKERDEEHLNRIGCERAMEELRRCCKLDTSKIDLREVKLHIDGIVKERDELKAQLKGWEANATYSINMGVALKTEQLQKERDELRENWHQSGEIIAKANIAHSRLTVERDQLAVQLKELQGHIRCIYCNKKYTAEQSGELADHILSCEKSPLVQMNAELMEVANLIIGSSDPDSVIIEAEKRIKSLPYNPILKQRDDALDKLKLSEAQVVQLMDENNSLKLDYSHSEAENAKLAAKCAEMKAFITTIAAFGFNTADKAVAARHALSDQCGVGWLSPEKKKALVEVLELLMDLQNGPPLLKYKDAWESAMEKAKQALEESAQ